MRNIAIILVITLSLTVVTSGLATAQTNQANQTIQNALNQAPSIGNTTIINNDETTVEVQLSQKTWISDYDFHYQNETAEIAFQTNRSVPASVTITQVPVVTALDGTASNRPQDFTIRPNGTTVVTASIRSFDRCQAFGASTRFQRETKYKASDACTASSVNLNQYDVLGGFGGILFGAISVPSLFAILIYIANNKAFSLRRL